jgi:hypothetical protein
MSHTIEYGGESSVAVDAVLAYLATQREGCEWYVEIEDVNGIFTTGWVTKFEGAGDDAWNGSGPAVTLDESSKDDYALLAGKDPAPFRNGRTITIPTIDIIRLEIP